MMQLSHDQTITGEIIEELAETVIKQELPEEINDLEGFDHEIGILKEEDVEFYSTRPYLKKGTFKSQQNGCLSESKYEARVEESECDSHELDICTLENKCRKSPVQCKEEDVGIKYEDLQTYSPGLQAYFGSKQDICEMSGDVCCPSLSDVAEQKSVFSETVIKEEIHEDLVGLAHEIETLKEEAVEFYPTGQYLNRATFDIQENECVSESKYEARVEQNGCDGSHELDMCTLQNECRKSPVQCKEETIDIKYEDLRTESVTQTSDERCSGENERRRRKRKIIVHEESKKSNKTKRVGNNASKSKCQECSYVAKKPSKLKNHVLVHRSKSEVDLHKCKKCAFSTKYATSLIGHMLVHKPKSEIDLYKCPECSFAAKRAGNLKRHMLVHRAKSEVTLYKCPECSYAAKVAGDLKRHMLVHGPKKKVVLHQCQECSHAAKRVDYLRVHMLLIHGK